MDERRPVWDEIGANRFKSFLLMVGFGVLVGLAGWTFGELTGAGPAGSLVSLAFAGVAAFSTYWYCDRIVLAASGAKPVDPLKHRALVNLVEGLAIAAGLPVPRIFTIDDTAPNAFATGRDPKHAAIAVTTGLLDKLDRLELEGVLAHEMSHIANFDIRMTTLAGVMVGSVALLSDWMMRSLRWGMWSGGGRSRRSDGALPIALVAIVFAILAPIAAQLLRMAVSRQREYLADANGALLTRFPEGLARALEKLAADREPLEVANRATSPLFIVNPLHDHKPGRAGLFDTHPPIEERIRRLRAM
ncbi:MAG TPA: M48 family metallopeptidase [Candidatus Eisenbacteria bacterium]